MMTREELEAALQDADYRLEQGNSISPPYVDRTLLALTAAARRQLALMPEKCGTCGGRGFYADGDQVSCSTCRGSGKVYPPETVEKVKAIFRSVWPVDPTWWPSDKHAVAVLDALGQTE